jgi:6-phosphogluconolactonase (cycloisomerase 2 family)
LLSPPNGESAYVVDGKSNAVSEYSIDPTTGNLTPKSPSTVATGRNAEAIAISPNGKYVYVSNCPACRVARRGSHPASPPKRPTATIWEYRINQHTGSLTPVGTVVTGTGANGIAITPDGKSLYVAIDAVWQYTINASTGKLTPKSPATIAAPGHAHEIAIAPNGKNAYVVTVADNGVSQYSIDPKTGALNSRPLSTARTVLHPEAIKLNPDGTSAYVTSENDPQLSQYSIDPTTGTITPMSPAAVPTTGSGSLGLAITP